MKRPFFVLIISFLAGITVAGNFPLFSVYPYWPVALGSWAITAAIILIFFRIRSSVFLAVLCLVFFSAGFLRYSGAVLPRDNDISNFAGEDVVVRGTVREPPGIRYTRFGEYAVFPLRADRVLAGDSDQEVSGTILVRVFDAGELPEAGEIIAIEGNIKDPRKSRNPGNRFSGKYLSHRGIYAVMDPVKGGIPFIVLGRENGVYALIRPVEFLRRRAYSILKGRLEGQPLGIAASSFLGIRSDLTEGMRDVYMKTGTMHVLAVSGLHVGMVALVIISILTLCRVPKRAACIAAIGGVLFFAVFTGCRPSAMRAAVMATFMLAGFASGRRPEILSVLGLSALIITFFDPGSLFSPGFILSYVAVLSLILIIPYVESIFPSIKNKSTSSGITAVSLRYVRLVLVASLAVWLGMIPLTARYFGIVSPSAIAINIFAIPLLYVVLICSAGICILGGIPVMGNFADMIGKGLTFLIEMFGQFLVYVSSISGSYLKLGSPGMPAVFVYYALLGACIVFGRRSGQYAKYGIMFLLAGANIFVWSEAAIELPASTTITFFDAGRADAVVVETPEGRVMVVDGGSGGADTGKDAGRDILEPYLRSRGIRRIDLMVMTHPHEDHIGGLLYLVREFGVDGVIEPAVDTEYTEYPLYSEFVGLLDHRDIGLIEVRRGDILSWGKGSEVVILSPRKGTVYSDINQGSLVMKLMQRDGSSALFGADISGEALEELLMYGEYLRANVVKAPHHGQGIGGRGLVRVFGEMISPAKVVITNRSIEEVDPVLLEALEANGSNVHVTGEEGAVELDL